MTSKEPAFLRGHGQDFQIPLPAYGNAEYNSLNGKKKRVLPAWI
jgi:hypothetical protein